MRCRRERKLELCSCRDRCKVEGEGKVMDSVRLEL